MKKLMTLLAMIAMVFTMSTTTYAADTKLTVSDASAKSAQMVYVTVSLADCKKANTIGLTMKYDSNVLKRVPGECSWTKSGTIAEFDVAKNTGVWTTKKAQDINGEMCTLAFRVNADAPVGDTKVTCEVLVKNDSNVIGTYTAEGVVTITCEHSYGEWSKKDDIMHLKECKYCQTQKTASHVWDDGQVTKEPTEKEEGIKTYQCKDCGATKEEAIKVTGSENQGSTDKPTKPENSGGTDLDDFFGDSGESDDTDIPENNERPGNTGSSENNGSSGENERPSNSGNAGNSGNSGSNERPSYTEKPDTPDYSGTDNKDTIEPNKNEESHTHDTIINNDKGEDVVEDHVHTEEHEHVQENNAAEGALFVVVSIVVLGILFFVYKIIKKDNKKRG